MAIQIKNWKFIKTVFIGDTVHVEMEVLSTKEMKRIGAGAVIIEVRVKNQADKVVMKGEWNTLVALQPI